MQGVLNKFICSIFSFICVCSLTYAIDNEYKNSLIKIELSKKDTNSYNIDLYTQKKYVEPVKVIKKSDLNYYILLPETKNSTSDNNINLQDIKKISTSSYSYAGQDKNGYTKVNINTSRPIYFNINVKSMSLKQDITKNNITNTIATNTQDKTEIQKKNLEQKKSVNTAIVKNDKVEKIKEKAAKQNTQTLDDAKKVQKQTENKKNIKLATKQQKITTKSQQDEIVEENKSEANLAEVAELEQINNTEDLQDNNSINFDSNQDELIAENAYSNNSNINKIKQKIYKHIKQVHNILIKHKLHIKYAVLVLFVLAGLGLFIALILTIMISMRAKDRRLELLGLNSFKNKTTGKQNSKGQYFVFDENISKNLHSTEPEVTEKKHFELLSYEPDIQINYGKTKENSANNNEDISKENEYDIIQKILKEDSLIDFKPDEISITKNTKDAKKALDEIEKAKNKTLEIQQKQISEPTILSSVEIAPERGFMCVSYNDSINLLGYIFDDVYALYNFKQPKLENYDIKYRLTDKDELGANFIVKVADTKMVIRVTKSFMTLEVLM